MATPDIELARLKALDEPRAQGADAWSPSRAREALRRYYGPDVDYRNRPYFETDKASFDGFCMMELGEFLTL